MKNFTTLIKETFEIYKEKIKPILTLIAISIATAIIFGLSFTSLLAMEMMDQADSPEATLKRACKIAADSASWMKPSTS